MTTKSNGHVELLELVKYCCYSYISGFQFTIKYNFADNQTQTIYKRTYPDKSTSQSRTSNDFRKIQSN